jgi:L,D-transpeptidase catalytic domain
MARSAPAPTLAALLALAVLPLGLGCRTPTTSAPRGSDGVEPGASAANEDEPSTAAIAIVRAPYKPSEALGQPIATLRARAARSAHATPEPDGAERGRILRGDSFHVYAEQEGPGCDRPWAQVAEAGWVCLERTEPSDALPTKLPELAEGDMLPFIYARHRSHDDLATPPISVYRSASEHRAGSEPISTLPAYGSYAFTRRNPNRGTPLFVTADRTVVEAEPLELFDPSEFSGRDLRADPPNSGHTLAWAVRWKTLVRAAPEPSAAIVDRISYHATLEVVGDGVLDADGLRWFEVPGTVARSGSGWISSDDIRRFVPVAPPAPVLGGQVTIDVDLDEQVLSVWLEDAPVFATLISSGKPNDRTPPGLYRVETKRAYGKMQSLPDAKEPYFVEAVPWVVYFHGRYALHAAYWHDMFGHVMSHGCVNLSPRDAKRVFEFASPHLPDGWLLVHEHASDPGALVRVRRAGATLPDRRPQLD